MANKLVLAAFAGLIAVASTLAGEIYELTGTDGKRTVKTEVWFGSGKDTKRLTAFDPRTKKFVYIDIDWTKPATERPMPVGQIWDHHTGKTIDLWKFPGAANPLPVIPSVDDLKVCPITGDKKPKIEQVGNFD